MSYPQQSILDELDQEHRTVLEQLLIKKLTAIQTFAPDDAGAGSWELLQLLHELGLIAAELRRLGPADDGVPF